MDPERWRAIEALVERAMEALPTTRTALVRDACGGDAALAEEVLALLAELEQDPRFLETPEPPQADPTAVASTTPEITGWRVVRRLGTGGMGEVWLAESPGGDDTTGRVAIKVVRADLAGESVLRRFELERRILATLRHPGIAALLDVTRTTDGRPCFVLEYVPGVPITTWADLHRLGLADRIERFLAVCEAVEHAHRALVVHRDIKPANILVTEAGIPKLLDFGIGKVLEHTTGFGPAIDTATSDRVLTLDHAAPEQLRGEVVTTATDVHALGVLLYELLTGVHPFRREGDSPGQVEAAILERVPDRPSAVVRGAPQSGPVAEGDARVRAEARGATSPDALGRRLAGDLDNIVLMALRKEPARRYPSVAAFADDLRRHRDGLPVRARPDTLGYRATKFVRRHAGSVAVAMVTALALIATTGVALLESRRASRNAAAARTERDEAVAVRTFLMETFGASDASRAVGASESVRDLLTRQGARIDELHTDDPVLAARLHEVVADAWERLGDAGAAVPHARRALALRASAQPPGHPDVAAAHNLLGWVLHQTGAREEAETELRRGLALRRAMSRPDSAALSRSLNDLGVLLNATNRYAEAESLLTEALAIRRGNGDLQLGVGITANNLAAAHYYQGRFDSASAVQAIALRALGAALGEDHQRSVIARANLAAFQSAQGDHAGAERSYRDLFARQSRLQGREHPVTLGVMRSLASALTARSGVTRDTALAEAEALLVEVAATQSRLPGQVPAQRGTTLDRLAGVRLSRGDIPGALVAGREAVRLLTAAYGTGHQEPAAAMVRLGLIEAEAGSIRLALRLGREGSAALASALGPDHPELARARGRLCRIMLRTDPDAAATGAECDAAEAALLAAPAGYRGELELVRAARGRMP